jgi:hypothetical protein
MAHLSADLLRRHLDEPDALLSVDKEHLLACTRCRAVREELAANAAYAERALALPPERVDVERARLAVAQRAVPDAFAARGAAGRFAWNRRAGWLSAAAAAVVLGLAVSLAPVRTAAENFLAIFEPHSFQPIALTKADAESLRGFPQLSAFGDVRQTGPAGTGTAADSPVLTTNPLDAMRAARQVVVHPRYVPVGVPAQANYAVIPAHTGAFTFSAAKAAATARQKNAALPPMPAQLDGSTLYAVFAPTVVTTYGGPFNAGGHPAGHRGFARRSGGNGFLTIFQSPAPRIYSTGASVREIVDYLLEQPGISPSLAAQIRAIGDPSTTLPIPIPVDKALAQTVSVGGAPALVVGDETGVGSVVVWETGGMVYGVAGPLRESELLAVANSLSR